MKRMIMVAAVLSAMVPAVADVSMTTWYDCYRDGSTDQSVGLVDNESHLEVWAYNVRQFPIYEVGKAISCREGANEGFFSAGYLSWWEKPEEVYADYYGVYHRDWGKLQLVATGYAYAPLNGGAWSIFSDRISLTYDVGEIKIGGLMRGLKAEGTSSWAVYGLMAETQLGHTTFGVHWTPLGNGPQEFRLQLSRSF